MVTCTTIGEVSLSQLSGDSLPATKMRECLGSRRESLQPDSRFPHCSTRAVSFSMNHLEMERVFALDGDNGCHDSTDLVYDKR